jgi:hypothetical protein
MYRWCSHDEWGGGMADRLEATFLFYSVGLYLRYLIAREIVARFSHRDQLRLPEWQQSVELPQSQATGEQVEEHFGSESMLRIIEHRIIAPATVDQLSTHQTSFSNQENG